FFQSRIQVRPRNLQRREKPEQHRGNERHESQNELGEQLPHQPAAARPQAGADGDLALSMDGAQAAGSQRWSTQSAKREAPRPRARPGTAARSALTRSCSRSMLKPFRGPGARGYL